MPISDEDQTPSVRLARLLRDADPIVFLTGAGMSTESGIPDFRSADGIYSRGIPEDIFDIRAFRRDPEAFYRAGRDLLTCLMRAEPHAGHRAIAALERQLGKTVAVITQNIDTLHQQAGSSRVLPVHGTMATSTCMACGASCEFAAIAATIAAGAVPRHRGCGGVYRPDIVFFGELLPALVLQESRRWVQAAALLVVAGTSLVVYPAAALPEMRAPGCRLAIINRGVTALDGGAAAVIREPIGTVLPRAVECLLDRAAG